MWGERASRLSHLKTLERARACGGCVIQIVITWAALQLDMLLDIAPFAQRAVNNGAIVLRWEEPRDIFRVEIEPAPGRLPPSRRKVIVRYWQDKWPKLRRTEADVTAGRICWAAWKGEDDWFNGQWRAADARLRVLGRRLIVTFAPLARREFPEMQEYSVTYRRTLKLSIEMPHACEATIRVFTTSKVAERTVAIELGCGIKPRPRWDGSVEVYNGTLLKFVKPSRRNPRLVLRLLCSKPAPLSHDGTIVTVRSAAASFSFRPDDVARGQPIWAPDLRVLVSAAEDDARYTSEYAASLVKEKCLYDRIADLPEQTLQAALKSCPPKRPMHFVVGIEGSRQKFGVEPNGDIFAGIGYIRRVQGPDTPRVAWEGKRLYVRFGWDKMTPNGRYLEEGYLPIILSTFSKGPLDVHEEVLATRLIGRMAQGRARGEDAVLAMARLTFENRGEESIDVEQEIFCESGTRLVPEKMALRGNLVYGGPGGDRLRLALELCNGGELCERRGIILYKVRLAPNSKSTLVVKFPFIEPVTSEEIASLREKAWDQEHRDVRTYWKGRLASGTEIHTGEQDLDDFHRALLTHILINDENEIGSDRIIPRVSSFAYGCFPNEAVMQIMELDRRGYHDEAARRLATLLHYQGTVGLPGNFKGKDGVFYGAGGYESGGYNQHHGWVLWGLSEHYRLTGDAAWLAGIADKLVAGCDWVARERRATMGRHGGIRPIEYGFLPAGSLEDVKDFCYWLSTNCLTYRGLAAAAEVLRSAGLPEGRRLVLEAKRYRADLLAGIEKSMVLSPLVRLRDGTYVPHIPSRLYWRGRDIGWIREVLEGSINLITTVLDPEDQGSTWILKDYEDNRYVGSPFGYALDDFDAQWFGRGGFSMQPNLVYTPSPYLARDQIEHFLRAFFNSFAACWRQEIRSMTEHPLPTLADWAGDHFKSSDESMVSLSLRLMFVQESGGDLYLGRAIPRYLLCPGAKVWIKRAETYFGTVSLEIAVAQDAAFIDAVVEPPTRCPPKRILLRLRHPHRSRISSVTVNGQQWSDVDPDKEWVVLPALTSRTAIRALYGQPKRHE